MKKVLLAIAVIALIGCASCSKTKSCKCSYTYMGITTTTPAAEYDVKKCSDITTLSGVPEDIKITCEEAK